MGVKIPLSRLPVAYAIWKRVGIFEHGRMDEPAQAFAVFMEHFEKAGMGRRADVGFTVLELGPGDSLLSALAAYGVGASGSYLVDAGSFATTDLGPYQAMTALLSAKGMRVPDLASAGSVADILALCSAQYLTSGLASLRTIPSQSMDFIWSNAVLEHLRAAEFLDTFRELRRILRPHGVCSHTVDLKDHLGGALNNLRFSKRFWESDLIAQSGFYTNRIRYSAMLDLFREAGFEVAEADVKRWESPPTSRRRLAKEFRGLADEDLCVSGFDVVLRPAPA